MLQVGPPPKAKDKNRKKKKIQLVQKKAKKNNEGKKKWSKYKTQDDAYKPKISPNTLNISS